jgi:hypothetical protein
MLFAYLYLARKIKEVPFLLCLYNRANRYAKEEMVEKKEKKNLFLIYFITCLF